MRIRAKYTIAFYDGLKWVGDKNKPLSSYSVRAGEILAYTRILEPADIMCIEALSTRYILLSLVIVSGWFIRFVGALNSFHIQIWSHCPYDSTANSGLESCILQVSGTALGLFPMPQNSPN